VNCCRLERTEGPGGQFYSCEAPETGTPGRRQRSPGPLRGGPLQCSKWANRSSSGMTQQRVAALGPIFPRFAPGAADRWRMPGAAAAGAWSAVYRWRTRCGQRGGPLQDYASRSARGADRRGVDGEVLPVPAPAGHQDSGYASERQRRRIARRIRFKAGLGAASFEPPCDGSRPPVRCFADVTSPTPRHLAVARLRG